MAGPVALVGAGEFGAAMAGFDQWLLGTTGQRRPRVAIVATAAYPAGEGAFQRATLAGMDHFRGLGAEVEAIDVRDRASAEDSASAQAVGEADLLYLCTGDAAHLRHSLAGTAVWAAAEAAHERGAILVGSAGAAMVLGERQLDLRLRMGWPVHWLAGLAVADGLAVLPSYDERPESVMALLALQAPRGTIVVGIDRDTAVVGRDGSWSVHGPGRVTVWEGRRRHRHRSGEAFRAPNS